MAQTSFAPARRLASAASTLATAALLAAVLAGCSTFGDDKTARQQPARIYADARDEMSSGNYDKAIPLFEKLEGRAAGTPLAQQAQLEKAYAQYKSNEQAAALSTIERFLKQHPASPAVDYALYLRGIVNFNDNLGPLSFIARQDLSERDQKAAKESFESFRELVARYPDSKYSPDARARMRYIVNSLAAYEVHVARYYFSRGAYVAAASRAQSAITDYQEVPAIEEAMFILMRSYEQLGLQQLAVDARRVMEKNYPKSEYLTKGSKGPDRPWWMFW
jgi:outer membrane protein assembly factor BamD